MIEYFATISAFLIPIIVWIAMSTAHKALRAANEATRVMNDMLTQQAEIMYRLHEAMLAKEAELQRLVDGNKRVEK